MPRRRLYTRESLRGFALSGSLPLVGRVREG
jgi:hypothetical protein